MRKYLFAILLSVFALQGTAQSFAQPIALREKEKIYALLHGFSERTKRGGCTQVKKDGILNKIKKMIEKIL